MPTPCWPTSPRTPATARRDRVHPRGLPVLRARQGMLRDAGIQFDELVLNRDYSEVTLRAVAGASMVPQVFINGEHIGGSDRLEEFLGQREKAAA